MQRRALLLGLLAHSAQASAADAQALGVRPRALVFPRDFGGHDDTRTEWWYVTGWLSNDAVAPGNAASVRPDYGFQLTFFRSRGAVASDHPSAFAARQLIFAHAALTDLAGQRLRHDQRIARAGFGIAQAATDDTDVALRGWQLTRSGPTTHSRYRARLHSDAARFALDLDLATTQPLLLQGQAGYSRKGPQPGQASHYYSQPQLAVRGMLDKDGQRQAVQGRAWLDHEWSESLLAPGAVGWDWIGINLFDGGALTVFVLRRADASMLWAGGSWRDAQGATRVFAADEVRMRPGRRWTSPASKTRYPVQWHVETPAGRCTVNALLAAQELDSRHSTGAIYWEGLSELLDASGRRIGLGYLEMTGYAAPLRM